MTKPLQDIRFFPINGVWMDATGNILADILAYYDIIVDDRTQFARLYDYERRLCIHYRASALRVELTIWRLEHK